MPVGMDIHHHLMDDSQKLNAKIFDALSVLHYNRFRTSHDDFVEAIGPPSV